MKKISCCSDFCGSTWEFGDRLAEVADAGFTHLFWCHHWCTDFIYTAPEIAEIRRLLKEHHLTLLDIHGSAGGEKCWFSTEEYQRLAGVELVRNRLEMLDALGGEGVVMMHAPRYCFCDSAFSDEVIAARSAAVRKSLDTLLPIAEKYHTKIALENLPRDNWVNLKAFLAEYPAELLGLCVDSGHAIILENRMDELENCKNRIIATHLHDNDGSGDRHQPPFYGTLDWARLTKIIAASSYTNPPSFEIVMANTPYFDPACDTMHQSRDSRRRFLADAYPRCVKVADMIDAERAKLA